MNDECVHEMERDTCFDCRPRPKPAAWPAQYEGICRHPTCKAVIDIGEPVVWNVEGTGVIHAKHRGS